LLPHFPDSDKLQHFLIRRPSVEKPRPDRPPESFPSFFASLIRCSMDTSKRTVALKRYESIPTRPRAHCMSSGYWWLPTNFLSGRKCERRRAV